MKHSRTIPPVMLSLMCVLSACAALTGGSNDTPETTIPEELEGSVEIEFWDRYCDSSVTDAVKRFNELHQGEVVVQHVCAGDSEDELSAKVRAAAAGGGLPQVVVASEAYLAQYDAAQLVVPLDQYVNSETWGVTGQHTSDFYTGAINRTRLPEFDGNTLSWPFGNTANALYFNRDLLDQAGIETVPETWDEFMAASQAIKERTGTPGWMMPPGDGADFIAALWTYGEPWISEDRRTVNFDNSTAVSILRDWKSQVDSGSAGIGDHEAAFISGRAGMVLSSSGNATQWATEAKGFDWDVSVLPHGPNQEPLTELYGSVTVMFSSDPEQQLASWLFMKYLASAENQSQMCPGQGCMPATKSSIDSDAIRSAIAATPQYGSAINEIAQYAQLLPQGPGLVDIRERIAGDIVTQVLSGDLNPEEGATMLQAEAQEALDNARE